MSGDNRWADTVDAETAARIHEVNARRIAARPPLTDEQRDLIVQVLRGARLRRLRDNAGGERRAAS